MFGSPSNYDAFFGARPPRMQRHRRTFKTYTSSFENSLTPYSSNEDMRALALAGPRVTETRLAYPLSLMDLPSRVGALSRRGAMLSTNLAHLTAVMEPLTNKKVDDVGERELRDILKEGRGLGEAMNEFEEQFEEVRELMKELVREKREVFRRMDGDERGWKGKGWKDDF